MTDAPNQLDAREYDPGSMSVSSFSTTRAVWYKRPWVLITFVVVVVAAVSVVTDLPHPISRAQDAADQNGALRFINNDARTCEFALKEAFNFYRMESAGTLSPSNRHLALNTLLPEDRINCSFASGSLPDMTENLQIVDTKAGLHIEKVRLNVVRWINHDARTAIEDIVVLFSHPANATALADLAREQDYLAQDRQAAIDEAHAAGAILYTTLVEPNLPTLERLPGT